MIKFFPNLFNSAEFLVETQYFGRNAIHCVSISGGFFFPVRLPFGGFFYTQFEFLLKAYLETFCLFFHTQCPSLLNGFRIKAARGRD